MAMPYQHQVFDVEPESDPAYVSGYTGFAAEDDYGYSMDTYVGGGMLHRDVEEFIIRLYKGLVENNEVVIGDIYDQFTRLSNAFYKHQPWPTAEEISHLVDHDAAFLLFYRELYFRHLHFNLMSSQQVTVEHRIASWRNFQALFEYILDDTQSLLKIPEAWLCAMVEEYIYQFHQFSLFKAANPSHRALVQEPDAWHVMLVLSRLQEFVAHSEIAHILHRDRVAYEKDESTPLDFEGLTVIQRMGYFSMFGLLRLHCMLGDYAAALQSIESVDFHRRSPLFYQISSLHLTVQYFQAFCMLMVGKHAGAVRVLSRTLGFLLRLRSPKSDEMQRRVDKMFSLLALCVVLSGTKPEDTVDRQLRERLGDRILKMTNKNPDAYLELFQQSCPKFISPATTSPLMTPEQMSKRQMDLFKRMIKLQKDLPELRSFLNLYTTVSTSKLANNMDITQRQVRDSIVSMKMRSQSHPDCSVDLPMSLDGEDVKVVEPNTALPTGDYFMRYIVKLNQTTGQLRDVSV